MSEYSEGKIYKIYIPGFNDVVYIGSTIQSLEDRFKKHKYQCKSNAEYQFASHPFFQEDCESIIELVEAYPCNSKQELLARERYWLEQFPEAINKNPPILDDEERTQHHAEAVQRYCQTEKGKSTRAKCKKEWDEQNKEHVAEYATQYAPRKIELARQRRANMTEEQKAEYYRKRNENRNKEAICPICSYKTTKSNLSRHVKSHDPL